jgi:peptide chain release factor 1
MKIDKSELKIETMRGTGPGGQHRNKTDSAVRVTHRPTGITAFADERSQQHSRRAAIAELKRRLASLQQERKAASKKARRDQKVKNPTLHIRTYDFQKGVVIDHRSGKRASVKNVVGKGKLDLLR